LLRLSYNVVARNTSADSENRIHDDAVAASYGFHGGLVPGVTVYAYMTAPIVGRFGMKWLEDGSMNVRFLAPFYDGEQVNVRAEVDLHEQPVTASIRAEKPDGALCATATATVGNPAKTSAGMDPAEFPQKPMPAPADRPDATREAFVVGAPIGTLNQMLNLGDTGPVDSIADRLTFYRGASAVAHPFILLGLANRALSENFRLGPWIHASSKVVNQSIARDGDRISVRGRVAECFERRGHEFVTLDLLLLANEERVVQQVRHTAIYRPRARSEHE
jgi:acyl dehydratase